MGISADRHVWTTYRFCGGWETRISPSEEAVSTDCAPARVATALSVEPESFSSWVVPFAGCFIDPRGLESLDWTLLAVVPAGIEISLERDVLTLTNIRRLH